MGFLALNRSHRFLKNAIFLPLLFLFGACGPGICANRCGTATSSSTLSLLNVRNLQVMETGFIRGAAIGLESGFVVGCSFDGGAITVATGTASWSCAIPRTWALGSRHTVSIGVIIGNALWSPQMLTLIKGSNKDINGDGYPDLVVGSPGFAGKGAVYVYLSQGSSGVAATPSFTVNDPAAINGDSFGWSVAIADISGDGYADLAVGSRSFSNGKGAAYVYLSQGSSGTLTTPSHTLNDPAATDYDYFGSSLAMADLTGDGYADLVVGSEGFSTYKGAAYVYLSQGSSGVPSTPSITLNDPAATNSDYFGAALATGDINGDGLADLVVGSYGFSVSKGAAYVFLSQGSSGVAITPTRTLNDPAATNNDYFGAALAMGDITGDGFADLVVGSYGFSSRKGAAYVYLSQGISGVAASPNLTINDPAATNNDEFGYSLGLADFTSDGYVDVVVGSPGASFYKGAAYAYFSQGISGVATTPNSTLNDPPAINDDYFGYSLGLSDFTGDGFADLVVGAPSYPGFGYKGAAYVYNSNGIAGFVTTPSLTLDDPAATNGDIFGNSISP